MALLTSSVLSDMEKLCGVTQTSGTDVAYQLLEALQCALLLFDTERVWRYQLRTGTLPVVANTAAYDLSTPIPNIGKVLKLYMTTPEYKILGPIDSEQYINSYASDATLTQTPEVYWFEGGDSTIRVYPIPDTSYTVNVLHTLYNGVLTTSTSLIFPDRFKPLLLRVARVCYKGGGLDSLDEALKEDAVSSSLYKKMIEGESIKDQGYGSNISMGQRISYDFS